MVKVVPFIVFCYAVQCFMILKINPGEFSQISLSILGGFLALMIASFIAYDLKHQVTFFEDRMEIVFLGTKKIIFFEDVWSVEIKDPGQSFSTITFITKSGKQSIYFADDSEKIKKFIEDKKSIDLMAA